MVNNCLLRAKNTAKNLAAQFPNITFPDTCLMCKTSTIGDSKLCEICNNIFNFQMLKRFECCIICALPMGEEHTQHSAGLICGRCQHQRPHFTRCIAATRYSSFTASLVNGLKHHRRLAIAHFASKHIINSLNQRYDLLEPIAQPATASLGPVNSSSVAPNPTTPSLSNTVSVGSISIGRQFDLIIPVPLHEKRLRDRGFNQAVEIAKPISRYFSLPVNLSICKRITDSESQQRLTGADRAKNLRNAFSTSHAIAGARVAVVDDVVTTTHTANAIAKSILNAGAIQCEIWCFARTPAPTS